jgi:virginiamycin B lyase
MSVSAKLLLGLMAMLVGHTVWAGNISGTAKDSTGTPFKGAFIEALNPQTKITVSVLSDRQGHYHIEDLSPGTYQVKANAIGYKSTSQTVTLSAGQSTSLDFVVSKGMVRWSDLNQYQMVALLPEGKGKDILLANCTACHFEQHKMAETRRDEAGWRDRVDYMRTAMHTSLTRVTDSMAQDIVSYLNNVFGTDSDLPRSPEELPKYSTLQQTKFSDEAMKIVYVDYDLGGPSRMPWSAYPDRNDQIWIPYYGNANRIAKLDPETGKVEEFRVPGEEAALIHSAVPAPDGTVWLTEQARNKIAKFDPETKTFTEYEDKLVPNPRKHTVRVDRNGNVWSTGNPLSRLDVKTGKWTEFPEAPLTYGLEFDRTGNLWFCTYGEHKIGKVDIKTDKLTKYVIPTPKSFPNHLVFDPEGILWFNEFDGGKIGRFDPKTETFKEYPLPGPKPTPYALAIDRNGFLWYSGNSTDIVGRMNRQTGEVVEYPFPYSEVSSREYFMDSKGRMWFASPSNNRVGYFKIQ